MIFAEKLFKLRKQAGLSQEELAAHLSVSRQTVSRWESGKTLPDLKHLLRISCLFGVAADVLLHEDDETETQKEKGEAQKQNRKETVEKKRHSLRKRQVNGIAVTALFCLQTLLTFSGGLWAGFFLTIYY